ncbi:hypothetical protein P175DRAFT_0145952 [Aspergillus ochraceoroseus IBT 24754]|uniref:Uncharacterized protein n=1 Tax=Aspergillus ochraceoroseus IBT 24754 TaxID=1392256 RepID=A0A2T5M2M4_9EURO|nr:uncharacterized protein P175DRAFT_0145952 [Aspergillus ochraceoroseus IBT 24754]PTU22785.1 hypothetical protein P175DRAFT_0145952 [Aspergillus ochraceoroseus IBT 24754]
MTPRAYFPPLFLFLFFIFLFFRSYIGMYVDWVFMMRAVILLIYDRLFPTPASPPILPLLVFLSIPPIPVFLRDIFPLSFPRRIYKQCLWG